MRLWKFYLLSVCLTLATCDVITGDEAAADKCEQVEGACGGVDTASDRYTEPLPVCPPPDQTEDYAPYTEPPSEAQVADTYRQVLPGGRWRPTHCRARRRVAVVVPYRDRAEHLKLFLPNIHRFMQIQQLEYGIYLAEQLDSKLFNRGSIRNVGFLHSLDDMSYDCVVLHDVDKYPENTKNSYACTEGEARHLIGQIRYPRQQYRKPPYATYFGGVTMLPVNLFWKINGYSNRFFGWGSEDDDLYNRMTHHGVSTVRSDPEIGSYVEIYNALGFVNPRRHEMVKEGKMLFSEDGLNSMDYTLVAVTRSPLYTNISVVINQADGFT